MAVLPPTIPLRTARNIVIGVAFAAAAALVAVIALPLPAPPAAEPAPPPAFAAQAPSPPPADPEAYLIRTTLKLNGPLRHGDWHWRPEAAPAAGPILITVDLKAQTLSVFRGGHEIGVAVINYGAPEKPTPTGAFTITQKDADHRSNIYDGAPMPWMLRLTNDGVAIHGAKVDGTWATNGCVGVPDGFAEKLFAVASLGDRVVITDGARLNLGDAVTLG